MSLGAADSFDPKIWLVIAGAAALAVVPGLLSGRKTFFAGLGGGSKKFFYKYPGNGGYGAVAASSAAEAKKLIRKEDGLKKLPKGTRVWTES